MGNADEGVDAEEVGNAEELVDLLKPLTPSVSQHQDEWRCAPAMAAEELTTRIDLGETVLFVLGGGYAA